MRKSWIVAGGLVLCAGAFLAAPRASSEENLDPIKVAPDTHKVIFENAIMRVIEAKIPPGGKEPKHRHPKGLTVYLADYSIEQKTFPDGKVIKAERKFGTVGWSDAIIHEVKNTAKTPSHAIRIELK
jgi:hypothetical protein